MTSIRARLLIGLLALAAVATASAGLLTYRRILDESSKLFDYQLQQMALSLRNQAAIAPRLQLPPDASGDFVIQIWDPFGARVYQSRPGLPLINRAVLGFADLRLQGELWRVYSTETEFGVIQIAQPWSVRRELAGEAALRIVAPLLALLILMSVALIAIVGRGLAPLSRVAREVGSRDAGSLAPLADSALPPEIAPLVRELNRLLARLAEAFEVQRAFVADAAHELRSPLTALRLQVQLLARARDETARSQAQQKLTEAAERSIHLAEQLLTLARNEPEAARGELEEVDLGAAARGAADDAAALASAREARVETELADGVRLRGDASALRTLARNLIDNALRYSPRGARVRVRVARAAGAALLEVADNGAGIPSEERSRIFDRFYRRAGSPEGGSGLGLAIVKAVAERHGAKIDLDDAPGGGLRVSVRFPVV